jgi:hypothetical protein
MRDADKKIEELEAIQLQFMEEWDAGEHPSLGDYISRYPQFARELTDFVLLYVEVESAAALVPEGEEEAPAGEAALERVRAGALAPASNLRDARKAFAWTPARLARELELPARAVIQFERGLVRDWSRKLECILARVLCCTQEETVLLLQACRPGQTASAHYSAQGTPQAGIQTVRTFAEVLEECVRSGEMTEEARRAWLVDEGD